MSSLTPGRHDGTGGLPAAPGQTYSRDVGTEDAARTALDGRPRVCVSEPVIEQMRGLPRDHAAAVARAVERIRPEAGIVLRIPPPAVPGGHYLAAVPDGPDVPVVIYRELNQDEGDGYLVTALADRASYAAYRQAERQGLTSTPLWRLLASTATAVGAGTGPAAGSEAPGIRPRKYKRPKPRSDRFTRRWPPRDER